MRQLWDDTHLILDGEVRVYPRELSKRWHQRCGQTSPSPLSAPELQYSPAHTDAHAGARCTVSYSDQVKAKSPIHRVDNWVDKNLNKSIKLLIIISILGLNGAPTRGWLRQ